MDDPVQKPPIQLMDQPKGKKRWLIVGLAAAAAAIEVATLVGLLPRALAVLRPVVEAASELLAEGE